ncbi:MAG: archaeosortase/exosortase family protein [Gammaproteobacteria bacterium]
MSVKRDRPGHETLRPEPTQKTGRRLVVALAVLTVFSLNLDLFPSIQSVLAKSTGLTANSTAAILSWFSIEAVPEGRLISHPDGFRYSIELSCTGFIPLSFLAVAIAFFPATRRRRVRGLILCLPYVLVVNQVRLVSLFYTGVMWPRAFDLVHEVLWECLMVVFIGGFWFLWIRGSIRDNPDASRLRPIPTTNQAAGFPVAGKPWS